MDQAPSVQALPDAPGAGPSQELAFPAPASIASLQTNAICAPRPRNTAVVHGDYDEIEEQCAKAAGGSPAEVVAWAAYGRLRVPELGAVSYTHLTLPTNREV